MIRQNKQNLKVCKCSGEILFDQLIGAGVTNYIITSHCWNGVGPQPAWNFKRTMEEGIPQKIIYNEQSLFMLLGLSFIDQIINSLKGEIWVSGSNFLIIIPKTI